MQTAIAPITATGGLLATSPKSVAVMASSKGKMLHNARYAIHKGTPGKKAGFCIFRPAPTYPNSFDELQPKGQTSIGVSPLMTASCSWGTLPAISGSLRKPAPKCELSVGFPDQMLVDQNMVAIWQLL